MTLREAIALADELRPNALSESLKTQWLNEAEGMVQTNVMLLQGEDLVKYKWEDNADTELLAKFPHDKLYWAYLCAMIDYGCGDEDAYQNDMTLFNKRFAEFTRWYANTYRPADGQMENRLYYLTAYAIAVKHGFAGTEEEWLQSLVGPAGEAGADGAVEVRYSESTWDEVKAAIDEGKPLICRYETGAAVYSAPMTYAYLSEANSFVEFRRLGGAFEYTYTLRETSGWSSSAYSFYSNFAAATHSHAPENVGAVPSFQRALESEESMDDLTDEGNYYCSKANAQTVENAAFDTSHYIKVRRFDNTGDRLVQTAYSHDVNDPQKVRRTGYKGTWSDWQDD